MPTVENYMDEIDIFLQQGGIENALAKCSAGLAEHPDDVNLMTSVGRIHWAGGDVIAAAEGFNKAIETHPEDPFLLLTYAGFLLNNGFAQDAYTHAERALKAKPDLLGPRFVMARAAMTMNRGDMALAVLEDVKVENIDTPLDLMNAGVLIHCTGEHSRADAFFAKARPLFPELDPYLRTLCVFANNAQNYPLAVAAIGETIQKVGDRQDLRDQLAYSLSLMGLFDAAAKSFTPIAMTNPDHPEISLKYAHYLIIGNGTVDEISQYANVALEHNRDNPQAIEIMARMKAVSGDIEEAGDLLNRAIELKPDNFNLYGLLGNMIPIEKDHFAFKRLEGGKAEVDHPEVLGLITKTLGQLYLSVGESDKAFEAFAEGNEHTQKAAQAIGLTYVADLLDKQADDAIALFKPEFREMVGDVSDKSTMPLYVVGMPGTGGATLASLLARHSEIADAGPRYETAQSMLELEQARLNKKDKVVARHIRDHAPRWRQRILEALDQAKGETEKDAKYVIDSFPSNFNTLGLVNNMFPKAKCIHIKRDPLDLAFAIYSGTFQLTFSYATSIETIAHFMKTQERQIEAARQALGDNLLEINYEDLVQNTGATLEKVVDFLGLDWEDNITAYDVEADEDKTMSAIQIRSQLKHHGIGEGEKYKAHLGDLTKALGA